MDFSQGLKVLGSAEDITDFAKLCSRLLQYICSFIVLALHNENIAQALGALTYVFKNQKFDFTSQEQVTVWAQKKLTDYCFLYSKAEGDDKTIDMPRVQLRSLNVCRC